MIRVKQKLHFGKVQRGQQKIATEKPVAVADGRDSPDFAIDGAGDSL